MLIAHRILENNLLKIYGVVPAGKPWLQLLGLQTYEWDPSRQRFRVHPKPRNRLGITYFIVVSLYLWFGIRKIDDFGYKIIQGFYASLHVFMAYVAYFNQQNGKDLSDFLNGLIKFEKDHYYESTNQFTKSDNLKLLATLSKLMNYCGPVLAVLNGIATLILPSSPFNILYTWGLYSTYLQQKETFLWIRIFEGILSTLMWLAYVPSAQFIIQGSLFASLFALICMIKVFKRNAIMACTVGKNTGRGFFRRMLVFREIQLLTDSYNLIHREKILATCVCISASAQIGGLYFVIHSFGSLSIPAMLASMILISNSMFFVVFLLGFAAKVLAECNQTFHELKRVLGDNGKSRADIRKFMKSCRKTRIQFFSVNFFERMTPLIIQDFCITQTANLLLL